MLTMRPHQKKAVAANANTFLVQRYPRAQNIMACGTGKTLVGIRTAERLKAKRILVAVPTLALLAQTLQAWTENSRRRFRACCVCSDATVDEDGYTDLDGEDEYWGSESDQEAAHRLSELVTTNPDLIGPFQRSNTGIKAVFCTYASLDQIAASGGRQYDLFIMDEAHRTACSKAGLYGTALDNELIPCRHRLAMTATRRIFKGEHHEYVNSMCDEERFGPVTYSMNFGQAIKAGLLCEYKIVIAGITESEYYRYAEAFPTKIEGEPFKDAHHLATHVLLAKAYKDLDLKRVISFHSRVQGAKLFAEAFPKICQWMPKKDRLEVFAQHINAKTPTADRGRHLHDFASVNMPSLITNARCLTEGVDIPVINGVCFVDPKQSHIDIIQATGRALRKNGDPNKIGYLIIPILVPDDADEETPFKLGDYATIWKVVSALKSMDERLAEALDFHNHHPQCQQPATGKDLCGTGDHVASPDQAVVTALGRDNYHEPPEDSLPIPHWSQWVDFKMPPEVDAGFCGAIRAKVARPGLRQYWDYSRIYKWCVDNNITSYKQLHLNSRPSWVPVQPWISLNDPDFFVKIRMDLGISTRGKNIPDWDYSRIFNWCVHNNITSQSMIATNTRPSWVPFHPARSLNDEYFFEKVKKEIGYDEIEIMKDSRKRETARRRWNYNKIFKWCLDNDVSSTYKLNSTKRPHWVPSNPCSALFDSDFFKKIRKNTKYSGKTYSRDTRWDYNKIFQWCVDNSLTCEVKLATNRPRWVPSSPKKSLHDPDFFKKVRKAVGVPEVYNSWDKERVLDWCIKNKITSHKIMPKRENIPVWIPTSPHTSMKDPDFFRKVREVLGVPRKGAGPFYYNKSLEFCIKNKITSKRTIERFKGRPSYLPFSPNKTFKDPDFFKKVREALKKRP